MAKKTKAPKKTAADNTAKEMPKKSRAAHLEKYKVKPGQCLNPKGRPKGSRNRFAQAFIDDFMKDWEENGAEVLQRTRSEDPATYLRVAASIIPKELNINADTAALDAFLDKLSDTELDNFIRGVATYGATTAGQDTPAEEGIGSESDQLH